MTGTIPRVTPGSCFLTAAGGLALILGTVGQTVNADDQGGPRCIVIQQQLLSERGSTRATRYANANKIVTLDGKTHVAWLDSISNTMIATYDHASGKWSQPVKLGTGTDNHGGPALTCDSRGHLHVIFGPHGQRPFQHCRSAKLNDSSSWVKLEGFAHRPTYPSVVCDDQNTLHVIYRGETRQGYACKLTYQRKPKNGTWSEPRFLAQAPDAWKGYTHYHASLTLAANNSLHVAYNIYYNGAAKHAGHMTSSDRGRTWTLADGSALDLPVTVNSKAFFARTDQAFKVVNIVCDSNSLPWISLADGRSKAGPTIHHYDGKTWCSFCPAERVSPRIALDELSTHAPLTVDSKDRIYLMTMLGSRITGGVRGDVLILYSTDQGTHFRSLRIFAPDQRLPHTGASMERPTGPHAVGVPWALFSTGEKGPDCFGKGLFHKVRAVQLDIRNATVH